jgi:hypothetical protein
MPKAPKAKGAAGKRRGVKIEPTQFGGVGVGHPRSSSTSAARTSLLDTMEKRARGMKTEKISAGDLARSGGPADE